MVDSATFGHVLQYAHCEILVAKSLSGSSFVGGHRSASANTREPPKTVQRPAYMGEAGLSLLLKR